jgi:hypothetical protein
MKDPRKEFLNLIEEKMKDKVNSDFKSVMKLNSDELIEFAQNAVQEINNKLIENKISKKEQSQLIEYRSYFSSMVLEVELCSKCKYKYCKCDNCKNVKECDLSCHSCEIN